jgi:hypothetical protein
MSYMPQIGRLVARTGKNIITAISKHNRPFDYFKKTCNTWFSFQSCASVSVPCENKSHHSDHLYASWNHFPVAWDIDEEAEE